MLCGFELFDFATWTWLYKSSRAMLVADMKNCYFGSDTYLSSDNVKPLLGTYM